MNIIQLTIVWGTVAIVFLIALVYLFNIIMVIINKSKPMLIGTSPSIYGIEKLINEYYCSTSYEVNAATLEVTNKKGPMQVQIKVVLKKGRYRATVE